MEDVFKALADPSRRALLERLRAEEGQTLSRLCAGLEMTRQAVTKHLDVLETAGVIRTERKGREKQHWLHVARLQEAVRWLQRFEAGVAPDRRRAAVGTTRREQAVSKVETDAGAAPGIEDRSVSLCAFD